MPNGLSTSTLYKPKLATVLAEGYGAQRLRKDALAAITVAIVALPLSMAIAVASGVGPERGLYAAIVGGAAVSVFGGSRFQIGGPAGAFIVLVASTVTRFGVDGLLLAVMLSGVMLVAVGLLRIGTLIRRIPHAVTVGFTCGIAATILASQMKELLGLELLGAEPGSFFPKLVVLARAATTTNPAAAVIGFGAAALIFALRRWRPSWPGMLIAVTACSVAAVLFPLPVETVGSRFGGVPHGLAWPRLPPITVSEIAAVFPTALSFTLLGGIESLLSARIADGMTGRVHRSNMELVAQGLANVASAAFGGISVTGTIARTATNIRAGATSPVSGLLHSAVLLLFLLIAAPLANYIPLAALAGVLLVVSWNMVEMDEFTRLVTRRREGLVLLSTFGLTLARDLTTGIAAGCLIALAFWLNDRLRRSAT